MKSKGVRDMQAERLKRMVAARVRGLSWGQIAKAERIPDRNNVRRAVLKAHPELRKLNPHESLLLSLRQVARTHPR